MHENLPDDSIINISGFRPGDVIFISRRGGTTPLNLATQRMKRWVSRDRAPFVGYAHVALAIGQDQVIHSTVNKSGRKQPHGVAVQSIYELAPDPTTRWEVLRCNADHPALDSVRDAALAYVGFAYNDRFDLKKITNNLEYEFAVYCSEFIALVFTDLELIDNSIAPHKTTPNLLHHTLKNSGWTRVAKEDFDFCPSPDWVQISIQNAALTSAVARNIIGQTLSANKLIIEYLNAHSAMMDIANDEPLALQRHAQLGSRSLVSLPVTLRARLAMSQLSSMAFEDAASDAVAATTSATNQKLAQWANLALKVRTLQWHAQMVDHFFRFEVNVATELVTRVRQTLNEPTDKKKSALEELYRAASALCHYFHVADLGAQIENLSEQCKCSSEAFRPLLGLLLSILYFYAKIESLLAIAGPIVMARLDPTPAVEMCLKEVAQAYEPLQPHISPVEGEGHPVVSVDAAMTASRASEMMIAVLRRRLTNPGAPAEGRDRNSTRQ